MNAMSFQRDVEARAERPELVWVVVRAKQGLEVRAKRELEQQGFEVYLPMRLYEERRTRELRAAPFFPCYLFAKVPAQVGGWRSIFSTFGVAGVLGCSLTRAVGVSDWVVERIRAAEEGGYIRIGLRQDDAKRFKKGDAVRVCDDLGLEGVFVETVDAKRCAILVKLLGGDTRAVVPLAKLAARQD